MERAAGRGRHQARRRVGSGNRGRGRPDGEGAAGRRRSAKVAEKRRLLRAAFLFSSPRIGLDLATVPSRLDSQRRRLTTGRELQAGTGGSGRQRELAQMEATDWRARPKKGTRRTDGVSHAPVHHANGRGSVALLVMMGEAGVSSRQWRALLRTGGGSVGPRPLHCVQGCCASSCAKRLVGVSDDVCAQGDKVGGDSGARIGVMFRRRAWRAGPLITQGDRHKGRAQQVTTFSGMVLRGGDSQAWTAARFWRCLWRAARLAARNDNAGDESRKQGATCIGARRAGEVARQRERRPGRGTAAAPRRED
jgi:hypothetical protein